MILEKSNHLKVSAYASAFQGLWPFIFKHNPVLRVLYDLYAKILILIFTLNCITQYVQLCILLLSGDNRRTEIMQNLCATLINMVSYTKMLVLRAPRTVNLLGETIRVEKKMYASRDDDVIRIYDSYVKVTQFVQTAFLVITVIVSISYVTFPLFVEGEPRFNEATNTTTRTRLFVLSAWVPFDPQEYYWVTYTWQSLAATVASLNLLTTHSLMFGMVIFPLGQLKILQHILRNFQNYSGKIQEQIQCGREEASFLIMRQCIVKHKEIIRYVNEYDECIKMVMVCDFLASSLQLAMTLIQLVETEASFSVVIQWSSFAMSMLMRLFVHYWFANDIMIQSSNIGNAVWEAEWYEESKTVKQLMLIMIMRSHKTLGLHIGPFGTITLEAFLGIMRAAYSYLMLMHKLN